MNVPVTASGGAVPKGLDVAVDGEPSLARARKLGLHTHHELVALMSTDSPVCRAEGLAAHTQIFVQNGAHILQVSR